MCKEMPVILVNKVVDLKRIIGKKWRAEEEERHKGSLTPQKTLHMPWRGLEPTFFCYGGGRDAAAKLKSLELKTLNCYLPLYSEIPNLFCRTNPDPILRLRVTTPRVHSQGCFENKNIFLYFEKALCSLLHRYCM
jgi:hypothetical protein